MNNSRIALLRYLSTEKEIAWTHLSKYGFTPDDADFLLAREWVTLRSEPSVRGAEDCIWYALTPLGLHHLRKIDWRADQWKRNDAPLKHELKNADWPLHDRSDD